MNNIKIKPNWEKYLHNIRKQEIVQLGKYFEKYYDKILEIGAGDGYQSRLLANYCNELHCTELNAERLIQLENPKIKYKICDAEKIDEDFPPQMFDMAFSSNVFEHLPNPIRALRGISKILKDDGILINIMPNPTFDFTIILFHYPNFFIRKIESVLNKLFTQSKQKKLEINKNNNLKTIKKIGLLSKLLNLPKPHGIHNTFKEELQQFSKKNWISVFKHEGFEIIEIIKGPFYSGYGFGLLPFKVMLESIGICSEYIYVLKKSKERNS